MCIRPRGFRRTVKSARDIATAPYPHRRFSPSCSMTRAPQNSPTFLTVSGVDVDCLLTSPPGSWPPWCSSLSSKMPYRKLVPLNEYAAALFSEGWVVSTNSPMLLRCHQCPVFSEPHCDHRPCRRHNRTLTFKLRIPPSDSSGSLPSLPAVVLLPSRCAWRPFSQY